MGDATTSRERSLPVALGYIFQRVGAGVAIGFGGAGGPAAFPSAGCEQREEAEGSQGGHGKGTGEAGGDSSHARESLNE